MRTLLGLALGAALLAGGAAWLWSGAEPDAAVYAVAPQAPEVLLVADSADPYAWVAAEQTRFALQRARVPFDEHDLAGAAPLPALDAFAAVLTAAERLDGLSAPDAARLAEWVEGGGGLAVLYRGWSPALSRLLGFAASGRPAFVAQPETLRTATPLMPGEDGLTLRTGVLSAFGAAPAPSCTSLADRVSGGAVQGSGGWTCARGAGRVVFWNHAAFATKVYRGHILQTLALVHPAHARPVAAWAVVFLDDFPSPASNSKIGPPWSQHGQTPAEFYAGRWYPDMVGVAEEAGLVYTSTVVYAYNGRTRPPFPLTEWLEGRATDRGESVPYSPWIMSVDARRSELALHGYNHQPLTTELWGGAEPMRLALQTARQRWQLEDVAPLPRTYVPPMNRIDSVGVAALREVFPEITTIASVYTSEPSTGGGREFGPEPWAPALYALPRNTSGFLFSDAERLKMLSVLHTVGGWNHFVHPDELYANADREANYREAGLPSPTELGWDESERSLLPSFRRWVGFAETHYPWLDGLTAEDAARRMRAFDALAVGWQSRPADAGRQLAVSAQPGRPDVPDLGRARRIARRRRGRARARRLARPAPVSVRRPGRGAESDDHLPARPRPMTRILLSLSLLVASGSAWAQASRDSLEARLAQAPGDVQAHRQLSDLLAAQGEPAAAVPHLAWLAQQAPADPAVRRQLAQSLLWSDQPAWAADVLAEVVALDPDDVEARVQLAEVVTWDGGAVRAVELLAPVADAAPRPRAPAPHPGLRHDRQRRPASPRPDPPRAGARAPRRRPAGRGRRPGALAGRLARRSEASAPRARPPTADVSAPAPPAARPDRELSARPSATAVRLPTTRTASRCSARPSARACPSSGPSDGRGADRLAWRPSAGATASRRSPFGATALDTRASVTVRPGVQ